MFKQVVDPDSISHVSVDASIHGHVRYGVPVDTSIHGLRPWRFSYHILKIVPSILGNSFVFISFFVDP